MADVTMRRIFTGSTHENVSKYLYLKVYMCIFHEWLGSWWACAYQYAGDKKSIRKAISILDQATGPFSNEAQTRSVARIL